ncbi:MAG: FAD-dependent thymidylate synthase [Candidatus Nitrosocaldus sp.]|nr:FAD-dependent thymidylate synthase [Candidatus Nitrosocaldus sp.]MDW7999540.1 FAD-dependent thymidylate synthase [Candidatus Nitrosocaldus sp.]
MDEFTDHERELLRQHFSNTDRPVFVITTPRQVDRGALMSRYSRSSKSMRRVFLDEFLNNPSRGEEFYERVLVEYGDDSVAELGLVQVGIEGVSQIAAQSIEDRRIGLSYLEKSTRYVRFDQRVDGAYPYYRGSDIMELRHADAYIEACDLAFNIYSRCMEPMMRYLREAEPIDSMHFLDSSKGIDVPFSELKSSEDIRRAERAYEASIRARALDVLRALLPASTLTNLGIAGNARAFEYMLNILLASRLKEEQDIARMLYDELRHHIGPFIKRVVSRHGESFREYLNSTRDGIARIASRYLQMDRDAAGTGRYSMNHEDEVRLVDYEDNDSAEVKVVASILYEHADASYGDLLQIAGRMSREERAGVIEEYCRYRANRRHRPLRAFELPYYTFDLCTNFGIFRDLHRHRIVTVQRQLLTVKHGYYKPREIVDAGLEKEFDDCMYKSREVYEYIAYDEGKPLLAQYVVSMAYRYRYMIRLNLREAYHMIELRTSPQGHPAYRRVAQEMYRAIELVHPNLARGMRFVDMRDYSSRIEAEKRKAAKLKDK